MSVFLFPMQQVIMPPKIVHLKNFEFCNGVGECEFNFGPYLLHIITFFSKMV